MSTQVKLDPGSDEMLTPADVCKWLGLNKNTLASMVCRKTIPHVRLSGRMVRFIRRGLEEWLAARAVMAVAK